MISFNYETDFILDNENVLSAWISKVIISEGFKEDEINIIFCDDEYLLKLNLEFLSHDTLTDIISFDYSIGKLIQGDVYISVERVQDNANDYGVSFVKELHRVIVHGILHYCGYKDKSIDDAMVMREMEDCYVSLLD